MSSHNWKTFSPHVEHSWVYLLCTVAQVSPFSCAVRHLKTMQICTVFSPILPFSCLFSWFSHYRPTPISLHQWKQYCLLFTVLPLCLSKIYSHQQRGVKTRLFTSNKFLEFAQKLGCFPKQFSTAKEACLNPRVIPVILNFQADTVNNLKGNLQTFIMISNTINTILRTNINWQE